MFDLHGMMFLPSSKPKMLGQKHVHSVSKGFRIVRTELAAVPQNLHFIFREAVCSVGFVTHTESFTKIFRSALENITATAELDVLEDGK